MNLRSDGSCTFERLAPASLFMAVPEEAAPIVKMAGSSLDRGAELGGMGSNTPKVWHFYLGNIPVVLCLTGMGYEKALKAARTVITRFKPFCIISSGFAGGLVPHLNLGDVAGYRELANSSFVQPSEKMLDAFKAAAQACSGTIKSAEVKGITSSKVAATVQEKAKLKAMFEAEAVDMEASAAACDAGEFGLPWGAVKVISDTSSENMPLDFEAFTDSTGQVNKLKVALSVLSRPAVIPKLCAMAKTSSAASKNLTAFLAYYISELKGLVTQAAD